MNRPYIVCHMLTSLVGMITGPYMKPEAVNDASDEYERINADYQSQGWRCGRVTTDANLTHYQQPPLDENAPAVPDLMDRVLKGTIQPGKVFDLTLPLAQVAEGYKAMDERRAIKTLLRVD